MMNYVGSISILDRGEIHAQAIIDKNARSLAQRIADETKDELDKVMTRVENIYVSYEQSTQDMFSTHSTNVEYIEDIKELEEILTDQIKKKKYQQQVTVFIVGFENLSNQRLKLIQQVNEFFMDATRPPDEEEVTAPTPDIDLEEVSHSIEESLNSAEELADRLGELNKEMVDWLTNYAINKASSKLRERSKMAEEGKKKLEKALSQAKDDLSALGDKLVKVQTEMEEKEDKVQQMLKQLESKTQDVQKFRTAAEVAKKRMEDLQNQVEGNKSQLFEAQRDWQKLHDQQILALTTAHKQEMEDLKAAYEEQMKLSKGSSAESKRPETELDDELQSQEHLSVKIKESRPSTKASKQSTPGQKQRSSTVQNKSAAKSIVINQSPGKVQKETSDASVQDEGGDPASAHVETRQSKRARSTLQTVQEADVNFDDIFDIKDNQSWATVPVDQVPGRFVQYRNLTQKTLEELEEKLHITVTKTQRKVQTLKSQFQEHKGKWEAERKVLIEQVEQAQKLQNEAEKEADNAMTQLEEFINEQERLEEEEEEKRNDIAKGISRPVTVRSTSEKKPPSASTEVKVVSPEPVTAEGSEQELNRLMQQTDDAKAQEMARLTSGSMSAPPAVEPEEEAKGPEIRKTQTDPEFNTEPSITEEDVRLLSAASRASLRSQFKTKLEETRQAVEDRRSKSPAISVPSQRSLEADQLVDEEDDLPMEDVKEVIEDVTEMGTSPPPSKMEKVEHVSSMSRKSITGLQDHPVVKEYLKAYDGVQFFRDSLSKILLDKEMLQAGDIIQDLDMMKFDRDGKVQPQLETMTKNIYFVLEEIISILGSIMVEDREPVVSSLTGMLVSRDGTKNTLAGREKSAESGRGQTGTRASNQSITGRMHVASASSEKVALKDLQQQYVILQEQLNEETKKHEEQLRHNTVVMMEMQDTINELQRELTALGRASSRMRPASEAGSQQPESAVMFTRLDSERNAKIMKRAVNDRKLDTDKYKEAVNKMDDYVSLPAQRLGHLVRKYVHHCQMKEIEENVKKSKSLNENVFEILDKMEGLQNQRAKRWADKMDEMGSERIRLANLLMETLDSIEQESGIFLIKPMYSYRGREMRERYGGKLSRPLKPQRNLSPMREVSSYAPAPTPASNARGTLRIQPYSQPQDPNNQQPMYRRDPVRPLEGDDTGLMGSQALAYAGTTQRQTWNLNASMVRGETADQHMNLMNTPRILELDINRMLIGQNTISTKLPSSGISEDRLVNASQNNLRSYVTVNRPSAQPGVGPRPRSFTGTKEVPPSSPNPRSGVSGSAGNKRVRMSDVDQSRSLLSGTPPLPPIAGRGRESPEEIDHPEPPRSPIGSSLRVSPPHIQEVISPLK